MSGSGHNHSFNTILYNNKLLLNRRTIFKKDRSFLSSKNSFLKAANGKIDLRKASKQELLELRKKVIKERRRNAIVTWLVAALLTAPVILIGVNVSTFFMTRAANQETEKERQEIMQQQAQKEKEIIKSQEEFEFLISDGDKWLEQGKLQNAIHQYERAVELSPNDFYANLKLANAYFIECEIENKTTCEKGTDLIKSMQNKFPDREIVIPNN